MSIPDIFPTEIRILPTGMPRDHPEAHTFALAVRYRGTYTRRGTEGEQDWYAVESCHGTRSLSRAGKWKWDVARFQRWQYRFTFNEAIEHAFEQVDQVKVNGRTFAEWEAP